MRQSGELAVCVKCVRQSESESVSSRACVSGVAEQSTLQGKSEENAKKGQWLAKGKERRN